MNRAKYQNTEIKGYPKQSSGYEHICIVHFKLQATAYTPEMLVPCTVYNTCRYAKQSVKNFF